VDLTVDPETRTVNPNEDASYTITVTNLGNVQDTFNLTYENPQNADVFLSDNSVTLDAGNSENISLTVSSDRSGDYTVIVTATSQGNTSENDSVETTTHVRDSIPPTISNLSYEDPLEYDTEQNVSVSVEDNVGVDSCLIDYGEGNKTMEIIYTRVPDKAVCEYLWAPDSIGTIDYIVYASDTSNNWNSKSGSFLVNDTLPPVIGSPSFTDPLELGESQTINVNVTDPSGVDTVLIEIDNTNYTMSGSYTYSWTPSSIGMVNFTVYANDTLGHTSSEKGSFMVQDTTPPSISNISVDEVTNDSVVITWNTDEQGNSMVEYGTSEAYGKNVSHEDYVTSHSIVLTELSPATTYHFRVKSTDENNNTNTSDDYTFTTASCIANFILNLTTNQTTNLTSCSTDMEMRSLGNVTANITVISYIENPQDSDLSVPGLGKYVRIEVNDELQNNLDWVMIKIHYTDEEVNNAGLDENSLKIYWYNETSKRWIELNSGMGWVHGTRVNTDENYIWVNMSHFSDYAVGGEEYSPPTTTTTLPPTGPSGGGGGLPTFSRIKKSCFDGIQNCHDGACEEGVDCGGPCPPCPSCSDGIQNQGEEGIDCGGPCPPCPTTTTTVATTTTMAPTTTTTVLVTTTTSAPVVATTTTMVAPSVIGRVIADAGGPVPIVVLLFLILFFYYKVKIKKG